MLVLNATTKSIVAIMAAPAATNNPDFTAAFADSTGTSFTESANDGALNGTSQVTIVAAPASGAKRVIKSITIENRDTSAVTITLSYDNNGTLRTIANVTLQVGDTWTTNGTFDTNGNLKQTLGVVDLASQVSGILPVPNGGTGAATLTGVVKGTGTSALTAGQVDLTTEVTGTLPVANGGTGITSFGTGVATWLGTPSSANLAAALTDETGSGFAVFSTTPTITGLREKSTAVSASDIDLSAGNYFTKTISGATTFTVSNVATSGDVAAFILVLTNGGSDTVTFFSGVTWAGGTAPTLTAAGVDVLGFFTIDGGTTWRGLVLALDIKAP